MATSLFADLNLASYVNSSGRNFTSAGSANATTWLNSRHRENLWAFLLLCQAREVDLFPITWHTGLGIAGSGGQGRINQADMGLQVNFAFKRWKWDDGVGELDELVRMYRAFMSEVLILSDPATQEFPFVVRLEGVCWEWVKLDLFCPVLVYERAAYGDLGRFMASERRQNFGIEDRLRICEQIATGLSHLHQHRVIHGDVNPDNILIFKESKDCVVPRITDFGYSTIAAANDACIFLATKEPWNAPEVRHRGFLFAEAAKTDIFSLGLLCFWLLFYENLMDGITNDSIDSGSLSSEVQPQIIVSPYEQTIHRIRELKRKGELKRLALDLVKSSLAASESIKNQLHRFFEQTLEADAKCRAEELEGIFNSSGLSRLSTTGTVKSSWKQLQEFSGSMHPVFQLPISFYQLMNHPDYRFRTFILNQIKQEYENSQCERCSNATAIFVATCYEVGFGSPKNHDLAILWSEKGGSDLLEVELQIAQLRSGDCQRDYTNAYMRGGEYNQTFSKGFLLTSKELQDAETELTRELGDIETVLGRSNNIAIEIRQQLAGIAQESENLERARDLYVQLVGDVDEAHGPTSRFAVHLRMLLSGVLLSLGQNGAAKECAIVAEKGCLANPRIGPKHEEMAMVLEAMSDICAFDGEWARAEKLMRKAIRIMDRLFGAGHPRALRCRTYLGDILLGQRKAIEAEILARENYCAAQSVLGEGHPETVSHLVRHAAALHLMGRFEEMERLIKGLLKNFSSQLGDNHPAILEAQNILGLTYYDQERWDEARELLETVLNADSHYNAEHASVTVPGTLSKMQDLTIVYFKIGRVTEGRDLLKRVLEALPRVRDRNTTDQVLLVVSFAAAIHGIGEFQISQELQESCLARCAKHFGLDNRVTLLSLSNLAKTYHSQQKYSQAEVCGRLALKHMRRVYGSQSQAVISCLSDLTTTLMDRKDFDHALRFQKEAYKISRKHFGTKQPETLTIMRQLARIYAACGRQDDADSMQRRVLAIHRAGAGDENL